MSYHRLPAFTPPKELIGFGNGSMVNCFGIPDTSDHGDEQKRQPVASDSDMIAVPRSLLGAALCCIRTTAGADSNTYKALSALAMTAPSRQDGLWAFLNMLRSLHNIDGCQVPELTWGQQIDFVQNPVKYFIKADDEQQAVIWREVARRQSPATPA